MCFVNLVAEVRLRFNLGRKSGSVIAGLRCASTELKSLVWNLRCASEKKKLNCASGAALLVVEKVVALCCAALLVKWLFVPTFGNKAVTSE